MKPEDFHVVITADQRRSRSNDDRVPHALARLEWVPTRLAFERTAGDEIQALLTDPAAVVAAVHELTRLGDWRVGVGLGTVEQPIGSSTRAARGGAYLAARDAVEAARTAPTGLALVADDAVSEHVSDVAYGGDLLHDVESALWLVRSLLERRTNEGWEVVDMLDQGLTSREVAAKLGVSPSAVSQRLSRSARAEVMRGCELAAHLLGMARSGG